MLNEVDVVKGKAQYARTMSFYRTILSVYRLYPIAP